MISLLKFGADVVMRPHVSFSECLSFFNCPYKHWLIYREKIERKDTIYTIFGTVIGSSIEKYKKDGIKNAWISIGKAIFYHLLDHDWPEITAEDDRDWRDWTRSGMRMFQDTMNYLDEHYPGWELVDFEYPLYEDIEGTNLKFKGYIDFIFKHDGKIYLWDFKTTKRDWSKYARSDTQKLYQVILYKHFYAKKMNLDPKDIHVAYFLLKRKVAKKHKYCVEVFEQTSGTKKMENSVQWLKDQAMGIEKGIRIRKVSTCNFCECGEKKSLY